MIYLLYNEIYMVKDNCKFEGGQVRRMRTSRYRIAR